MLNRTCRILQAVCVLGAITASGHAQKPNQSASDKPESGQAKLVSDERQKKMLEDADQLLAMAQQLKEAVDHTRRDELSVQVVKQAVQIEKLAKSAKDHMRQ